VSYPEKVKSRFIANALSAYGKAWALEFSHIWSIDEDIIIPPMRYVAHFLHEAQRHGALIAQVRHPSLWRHLGLRPCMHLLTTAPFPHSPR